MKSLILGLVLTGLSAQAHTPILENYDSKPIYADLRDLNALGIEVLAKDDASQVGYAIITPEMEARIQERAHQVGKCGGFESLAPSTGSFLNDPIAELQKLGERVQKDQMYEMAPLKMVSVPKNEVITNALAELSEDNLRDTVQWLSSFPNRNNKGTTPNVHVEQMKAKIEQLLQTSKVPYEISLIDHVQTKQKSIRVRLEGSTKPEEVIVVGAHLDSINQSFFGNKNAPGADDNASGSANVLDVLRVVSQKSQPQRSVEFFWYAGEESGLLGSAEIAQQYKKAQKNVIAVLQLDMTLFPGSGELVLGSMTDFTSPWLRDYLKSINGTYINVQILEDKCGYGCSDHASWYRQGYPTLMPFEATMRAMNNKIHTANDIITPQMSFKHSLAFSKIALVFVMDLANSDAKQLY